MLRPTPRWPARLIKPPMGAATIAWRHPLAQGLSVFVPLWEGAGGPRDLVRGVTLTASGTGSPTWIGAPVGMATRHNGAAAWRDTLVKPVSAFPYTLAVLTRRSSATTNCYALCLSTGSGSYDVRLGAAINGNATGVFQYGGTERILTGTAGEWATLSDFRLLALVAASETDHRLMLNGATVASSADSGGTDFSGLTGITIGALGTGSALFWVGDVAAAWAWRRALGNDELMALAASPWSLLRPVVAPSWLSLAPAGGATYNESLVVAASAALAEVGRLTMNVAASFTAGATVAQGKTLTMAQSLALSADAAAAMTGGLALTGAVTVTANAATGQGATLTIPGAVTLTASATQTASALAALLGLVNVTSNAGLSSGGSMVMAALAEFAASAQITGLAGNIYSEAATAAASAGMGAEAQAAFAAQVALAASGDFAAVARMIAANSLGLSADAAMTATATAQMAALLTLAASAILTGAGSVPGAVTAAPLVIRMIGAALAQAALTGATVTTPGLSGASVSTPSLTGGDVTA